MDNIILGNEIHRISEDDIKEDQVPRELSVIAHLAEAFVLEDSSPARSVEHIDSEHTEQEIIDGHYKEPQRL